jgi:hypothetical protein
MVVEILGWSSVYFWILVVTFSVLSVAAYGALVLVMSYRRIVAALSFISEV